MERIRFEAYGQQIVSRGAAQFPALRPYRQSSVPDGRFGGGRRRAFQRGVPLQAQNPGAQLGYRRGFPGCGIRIRNPGPGASAFRPWIDGRDSLQRRCFISQRKLQVHGAICVERTALVLYLFLIRLRGCVKVARQITNFRRAVVKRQHSVRKFRKH